MARYPKNPGKHPCQASRARVEKRSTGRLEANFITSIHPAESPQRRCNHLPLNETGFRIADLGRQCIIDLNAKHLMVSKSLDYWHLSGYCFLPIIWQTSRKALQFLRAAWRTMAHDGGHIHNGNMHVTAGYTTYPLPCRSRNLCCDSYDDGYKNRDPLNKVLVHSVD
jgi:hypothetical protein